MKIGHLYSILLRKKFPFIYIYFILYLLQFVFLISCHDCVLAAVTALAKFGAHCEDLMPSILVLLKRWEYYMNINY